MSTIQTKNFLVQTCEHCKETFEVTEGDVIFGCRWYHKRCWERIHD